MPVTYFRLIMVARRLVIRQQYGFDQSSIFVAARSKGYELSFLSVKQRLLER